jgi:catechol 2,3-dioxygenase-like lactoylglutathione lyase family enzyme
LGIHHVAIAVKDIDATHRFYSEAMGFRLAYVEVIEQNRGWAKHAFYETGSPRDQLIAFWDLHGIMEDEDWSADISRGLGLPQSINHLAFSAEDLDDIARRRDRWLAHGHDVPEIDHGWITSIYTEDPNGITVEFAVLTREFTEEDARTAERRLRDPKPQPASVKRIEMYKAAEYRAGAR